MSLQIIADEMLAILQRGRYSVEGMEIEIHAFQELAVSKTRVFSPSDLDRLRRPAIASSRPNIRVIDGTAQSIANRLVREEQSPLALLNFASARNPGGGFLNGAKAQEEDLCRCSGLYPCLTKSTEYYSANRSQDSLLYTAYAIFSPQVPFIKTHSKGDLLKQPFFVSVISAPAPNSGPFLNLHPGHTEVLEETFLRRWQNILCIAREQNVRRMLLGAWGCGAFGGDPNMASLTAKSAIDEYGSYFEEIVFAIPSSGRQSQNNLSVFCETFGSQLS